MNIYEFSLRQHGPMSFERLLGAELTLFSRAELTFKAKSNRINEKNCFRKTAILHLSRWYFCPKFSQMIDKTTRQLTIMKTEIRLFQPYPTKIAIFSVRMLATCGSFWYGGSHMTFIDFSTFLDLPTLKPKA